MMIVLDVCHASFSCKMDNAAIKLEAFKLITFSGENISKFANEAQRLIKSIKDSYALPYQLRSKIITKICSTQSLYINRSMYKVLDKSLAMEKSHGPHRDPKGLELSTDYKEYGPLGLCVKMRELYSNLVTTKQQPAVSATIPEGNLGSATTNSDTSPRKNSNGRTCHDVESEYQFKGHPDCPKYKPSYDITGGGTTGGSTAGGKGNGDWKFISPNDENTIVTVSGAKYYFCKH